MTFMERSHTSPFSTNSQVEVTRSGTAGSGRFLATGFMHGNRRWYPDRFRPLPTEITGTWYDISIARGWPTEKRKLISLNLNLMGHAEYYPSTNQTITYTDRRLLHILLRIMTLFDKPIHVSHCFAYVHHTLQYFSTAIRHTLKYFFQHRCLRLGGVTLLAEKVLCGSFFPHGLLGLGWVTRRVCTVLEFPFRFIVCFDLMEWLSEDEQYFTVRLGIDLELESGRIVSGFGFPWNVSMSLCFSFVCESVCVRAWEEIGMFFS